MCIRPKTCFRVTCWLSKAGQMTSPEVRASRSRLVRAVTGELAKSKDMHACVLTHATQKCVPYPISSRFTHRREAILPRSLLPRS